jgi:eukaryotic-like serine/threonine-protein kinase
MAVHVENIQMSPESLAPGTEVNGWRILERLGTGGFGTAYRVEAIGWPGEFFALKMARTSVDERVTREVTLLMTRAVHPHVVRLHAFGRWPHPATGYLYFVMDWVPGLPLHTWAETHNPAVRIIVEKLATVALVLEHLHSEGVLHRDLKPEHLLVRESDGKPILIDFGVGWYSGGDTLTTQGMAPGTPHLRSPEAVAYWRKQGGRFGRRYEYKATDDVYALGVSAYRVLTGHWPFSPQTSREELFAGIESLAPLAPSDVNRHIPRAVSDVILRMMAKRLSDRFTSCAQVYAALVAALSFSFPDSVEVELFTWEKLPQGRERRVRLPEPPTLPRTSVAPPLKRASLLSGALRRVGVVKEGRAAAPAPAVPGAGEGRGARRPPRRASGAAVIAAGLGGAAALAAWLQQGGLAPVSHPTQTAPTAQVGRKSSALAGQKVAREPEWPEPVGTADPHRDPPPAVVAPATSPEDESLVMNQKTNPLTGQETAETTEFPPAKTMFEGARKAAAVAAACTLLSGCVSAPELRPQPPREECPPGAWDDMRMLRIDRMRLFPGAQYVSRGSEFVSQYNEAITFREDREAVWIVDIAHPMNVFPGHEGTKVPRGAHVAGKVYVRDRLYGRFTVLADHTTGRKYSVCLELRESGTRLVPAGTQTGLTIEGRTSDPATVRVAPSLLYLYPVTYFGEPHPW